MQLLSVAVKEEGEKPDRKPNSLPYGLRNPHKNLQFETLKILHRNPQYDCTVHS
jgi:hypothetical protein